MADGDRDRNEEPTCIQILFLAVLSVGDIFLIAILIYYITHPPKVPHIPPPSQDPIFTVESTAVNSYNTTTPDSRRILTTVIELGIRARNPNPTDSCYFFGFHEMTVRVKYKDRDVAQGVLSDFGLCSGNETLLHVEAIGVDEVLEEEGRVMNVSLTGRVGLFGSFLDVTCVDVGVQKVNCDVTVTIPIPNELLVCPRGYARKINYCVLYQRDMQMNVTKILDPKSRLLECLQDI